MPKRTGLFRSRTDVVVAGVASGIARSLNTDPVIIRLIFILLTIFGGGGLLIYLVLWIALPQEDPAEVFGDFQNNTNMEENANQEKKDPRQGHEDRGHKQRNDGGLIAGLVLITIGLIFLADRFVYWLDFGDLWPVLLLVAGGYLIYNSYKKPNQ